MTCPANKKSHTLYRAWPVCRSHATIKIHLGHILDKTQGATRFSASRSPKPYLFTEGQSVQYGRTGLSAHTYLYILFHPICDLLAQGVGSPVVFAYLEDKDSATNFFKL